MSNPVPTDSADTAITSESPQYPYVDYPPYSQQQLHDLLTHLVNISGSDLASALSSLTEPTLYALAAALAISNQTTHPYVAKAATRPLREELRWRAARAMGTDPSGPTRRGRLVQMAGTFTTLTIAGASPLQRTKLLGVCPFCASHDFQLMLPTVRWRCFSCHRDGGLLEFAEHLLEI